jgi:hypothetical protein
LFCGKRLDRWDNPVIFGRRRRGAKEGSFGMERAKGPSSSSYGSWSSFTQVQRGLPVVLALVFCSALPAAATLGGSAGKLELDRTALHLAAPQVKTVPGYRYEVFPSKDLQVTQFINPATNLVFGVSWRGSRAPDLLVLLGFDPSKIPGAHITLHYSFVKTPTLIVETGGRMGWYLGRAVRTDLMPAGVKQSQVLP